MTRTPRRLMLFGGFIIVTCATTYGCVDHSLNERDVTTAKPTEATHIPPPPPVAASLAPPQDTPSTNSGSPTMDLEISIADAQPLLGTDGVYWLDCREQDEWDAVHIDGANLLPMSQLADRVGELDAVKDQHVIVYCHHGGRSLRVTNFLRQQGFEKAQSMAGGIDQWAVQIDPSLPRY